MRRTLSRPRLRPALALAVALCWAACVEARAELVGDGGAASADLKHITVPFKRLGEPRWTEDGSRFTLEIQDAVLGELTLTVAISEINEKACTFAAEGTDYEWTQLLPAEDDALAERVVQAKRRLLGEPLDAERSAQYVRFLVAAGYHGKAQAALVSLTELSEKERQGFADELRAGRIAERLRLAREQVGLHQYEDAGRLIADALSKMAAPEDGGLRTEELKRLQTEAHKLQERISDETQAMDAWSVQVRAIKKALEGALGDEAKLIRRLLPDLDGPLSAERRRAILASVHVADAQRINYSQAIDALKAFSFEVRYGGVLKKEQTNGIDAFFDAELAINAYLEAPAGDPQLAQRLELALSFPGLTDEAFEALVRLGKRALPPPAPKEGRSKSGPFTHEAPKEELELGVTYKVLLPEDYHPSQRRPLLVALHGKGEEALDALRLWGPDARKRGWLAAAPELPVGRTNGYLSTLEERKMALRAAADCARNFAVDPARVYLAGYDMGGDMAWDVALTYPDRFAAFASVSGVINGLSANYYTHLVHVPGYAVFGERDERVALVTGRVRETLLAAGLEAGLKFSRYRKRGRGTFPEEIPAVLEWMGERETARTPARIDLTSADIETARAFWLEILNQRVNKRKPAADPLEELDGGFRSKYVRVQAAVGENNLLTLTVANARGLRVYVARERFDLHKPLRVALNGKPERPFAFTPARRTLLETARALHDRERLYWAIVDLPMPK